MTPAQLVAGRLRADARSARARRSTPPTPSGPTPTSTTRPRCCARCARAATPCASAPSAGAATSRPRCRPSAPARPCAGAARAPARARSAGAAAARLGARRRRAAGRAREGRLRPGGAPAAAPATARKARCARCAPYTHHQRELNDRLLAALEEQARRIDELQEEVRRGKHGIAAARRQSLAAEWRVEELQRRLAERRGHGVTRGDVVVVVPVYGARELFEECLRSVVEHTPPGTRVLVADDASPDPEIEAFTARPRRRRAGRARLRAAPAEPRLRRQHERRLRRDARRPTW